MCVNKVLFHYSLKDTSFANSISDICIFDLNNLCINDYFTIFN